MSNKITDARIEKLQFLQSTETMAKNLEKEKRELVELEASMDDAAKQSVSSSTKAAKERKKNEGFDVGPQGCYRHESDGY